MQTFWNSSRDTYPRKPGEFISNESLEEVEDLTPFELGVRHVRESVDLDTDEARSILEDAEGLAEARDKFALSVLKNIQFQNTIGLFSSMREYLESRSGPVPDSYHRGIKAAARALFTACVPRPIEDTPEVGGEELPVSTLDPFTIRAGIT